MPICANLCQQICQRYAVKKEQYLSEIFGQQILIWFKLWWANTLGYLLEFASFTRLSYSLYGVMTSTVGAKAMIGALNTS